MSKSLKMIIALLCISFFIMGVLIVNTMDLYQKCDFLDADREFLETKVNTLELQVGDLREELRKSDDSVFEDVEVEEGEVDLKKMQFSININVVPKEIDKNIKVYFKMNGKKIQLTRDDTSFKGVIVEPLKKEFEETNEVSYEVILEKNGKLLVEKGEVDILSDLGLELPYVGGSFTTKVDYRKNKYEFLVSSSDLEVIGGYQSLKELDFMVFKNGKKVAEEQDVYVNDVTDQNEYVDEDQEDYDDESLEFDEEFLETRLKYKAPLEKDDLIEYKLIGETDKGYKYEITVFSYKVTDLSRKGKINILNNEGVVVFEKVIIKDAKGNVVYEEVDGDVK